MIRVDWQDIARSQAGVVSRRQLLRSGYSGRRVDGLVARRDLVELMPSVYTARPSPHSVGQREWAAVLWSGGVLSHRSAARRWGLPVPAATAVHVTVADRRFRCVGTGIRTHRVPLPRADATTADGIAVTSRSRTVIDLLRTERIGLARTLLDRALQQEWIGPATLLTALGDGRGRTGNQQLRTLHDAIEPGAHAESERRLHAILRRRGLSGWQAQYAISLRGREVVVDVAFPEHRLVVEIDGKLWHDERSERFESDRERQNDLVHAGWRVLRFTWRMLLTNPNGVARRIEQELAASGG